jgi:hypothetical protein
MSYPKRNYQLKANIPSHIEHPLPLIGYRDNISIDCPEILGEVQVIGIGNIAEVRAIDIEGTKQMPRTRVHEIRTQAGIE